ncbi:MAG: glycosyltransferase family 4 protein [Anaerolineales bacterium]|nr:glycosyltransferase family 4 protein [Anaerolineales bacterium]
MYIYRLARALGDQGHHVDVVHCVDSYHLQHPGEPELAFIDHPNVTRHELRSPYRWLSPLLTHQTGLPMLKGRKIDEILNSKPFDVIHYHNISLLGPQILTLQPTRGEAVKIYTTHEHWLICPTHVLWKFDSAPCDRPDCLRCTLQAKRPPQLWRYFGFLERAVQHVDQFVAPSRFTAEIHAARGFPQPVEHLPHFIETKDSDWQNPGARPQEKPYFLFVGRLEKIKGLHTLIRIWDQIPQYDLLIAGAGNQETELKALSASLPTVKFLGPLSSERLGNYYFHALATLVPSITYETFGMVTLESFARKTPVIVRDLGALPETIQDSGGGFMYRTDAELLDAIRQIGGTPGLRDELGKRGYDALLRYWTCERHLELYFGFLERAARKKFNRAPWEQSRLIS